MNQEQILLPGCTFGPFTYVCGKNYVSGLSTFVLNLSESGNILIRNCPFSSASFSLVGEITYWCMNFEYMQLLIQHIMPNILHWNQFIEKTNQ